MAGGTRFQRVVIKKGNRQNPHQGKRGTIWSYRPGHAIPYSVILDGEGIIECYPDDFEYVGEDTPSIIEAMPGYTLPEGHTVRKQPYTLTITSNGTTITATSGSKEECLEMVKTAMEAIIPKVRHE